ncbi:hypothetical protein SCUCBS95973_006031 [Sporothrix curviconia]|uniref:HNH nuclease domain-containing protein n=1 Tax=Sporothrix curviconia TaxID=1260050 RepID=A0ABP0C2U1_9PEZI
MSDAGESVVDDRHKRKESRCTPEYRPVDVPMMGERVCGHDYRGIGFAAVVHTIKSDEWGSASSAAHRVIMSDKVTEANERLVRTFHPAFFDTEEDDVQILYNKRERSMWLVTYTYRVPFTHAGGLPIHYAPPVSREVLPEFDRLIHSIDMVHEQLDPRCLLTEDHLCSLRIMFPNSCGVRLWLSHGIEVLYLTRSQLQEDQNQGDYIEYIAGLQPVTLSVHDCRPTTADDPEMINRSALGQENICTSSLGLKLRLPNNVPAITTATHGFVHAPGASV